MAGRAHHSNPVSSQPRRDYTPYLYPNTKEWNQTLFGSFKPCPRSALACFCAPCFIAKLARRTGDHILTCLVNPCTLMAMRSRIRTAYHIKGSLIEDCYTSACCVAPCSAMQIEHELNHRGIPKIPLK